MSYMCITSGRGVEWNNLPSTHMLACIYQYMKRESTPRRESCIIEVARKNNKTFYRVNIAHRLRFAVPRFASIVE